MVKNKEDNSSVTKKIDFNEHELFNILCGEKNAHLKILEKRIGLTISSRGTELMLRGGDWEIDLAESVLVQLYELVQKGFPLYSQDIEHAVRILSKDRSANLKDIFLDSVYVSSKKRVVTARTVTQKEYIESIRNYDIVFSIGPAGTGKTYLAMAMAVASLAKKEVRRIVLARPAVEAGERLGFLPGDLYEKVNPYLRPLYDALHDMVDFDDASGLMEKGVIEVAPLAFMRGRTLNDSFVILDEAQNATAEQMKMFLTRLGFSSKAVITGDITQTDLPAGKNSGLVEALEILDGIKGIKFIYFSRDDVVRHPLVQKIIDAYDIKDKQREIRNGK
ncbi:MAG: PhoH family protein [Deltaproteobacteria bacterium]|nr:PhoH family protein [Deltaproteobacteria bacterium]